MDVEAVDIVKSFGGSAALHGVSLEVRTGELLALLGPSGSGKTTLLRVIAGLEPPDTGRVLFGGEDATSIPVRHRGVGFVFQHYALFRHLTVSDNIAYGLRSRPRATRPSHGEIGRRVGDLLALVQLDGLGGRFPAQLSGGQRQRVALARALAVEPRVLLLDEPFGALDARVRKDLRRWLREIHERTGQTTIFVTHDQDEALELADRVAILNAGRLEQVGTPDDVYDRPASHFVAHFLGQAVRFPARLVEGRVWIGEAPAAFPSQDGVSGPVELLSRSSDLRLVAPGQGHVQGTISLVRRAGPHRRTLEVRLANDARVDVEVPAERRFERGEAVGVHFESFELVAPGPGSPSMG